MAVEVEQVDHFPAQPTLEFVEVTQLPSGGRMYRRRPDGSGIRHYVHDIEGEIAPPAQVANLKVPQNQNVL